MAGPVPTPAHKCLGAGRLKTPLRQASFLPSQDSLDPLLGVTDVLSRSLRRLFTERPCPPILPAPAAQPPLTLAFPFFQPSPQEKSVRLGLSTHSCGRPLLPVSRLFIHSTYFQPPGCKTSITSHAFRTSAMPLSPKAPSCCPRPAWPCQCIGCDVAGEENRPRWSGASPLPGHRPHQAGLESSRGSRPGRLGYNLACYPLPQTQWGSSGKGCFQAWWGECPGTVRQSLTHCRPGAPWAFTGIKGPGICPQGGEVSVCSCRRLLSFAREEGPSDGASDSS